MPVRIPEPPPLTNIVQVSFTVRRYQPEDAGGTWRAFDLAVCRTAAIYYTPAQIAAWHPGSINLDAWNTHRAAVWTVVADSRGTIAGFGDLTADGVLDMLYVHPDFGGQGVARELVTAVLEHARQRGLDLVRTHASRAARPVFERLGFVVDRENTENWVRGQNIPNFDMHMLLAT